MNPLQDTSSSESAHPKVLTQALIATFAHDLRSPLSSIVTGLEVLKMSGNDLQQSNRVIEMIERQAHAITQLVEVLLESSEASLGSD